MSGLTITGTGITLGSGISIHMPPVLMLNLDAATYSVVTTSASQNINGSNSDTGNFFRPNDSRYADITIGWTVVGNPTWVVTAVSCNPSDQYSTIVTISNGVFLSGQSYAFTSEVSWIDSISDRAFILQNGVTYDNIDGGSLVFDAASSQSAICTSSLPNLSTWAVEVWHYYTGNNTPGSPEIVTETYTGDSGINYTLGSISNTTTGLSTGWWNGGQWIYTNPDYSLTPDNWYQIVGTYDGYNVNLYVNNTLVESSSIAAGNAYGSGQGIRLMERWDNAEYWDGKLGIVNIYDGYMNADDVTASWNANRTRFGL